MKKYILAAPVLCLTALLYSCMHAAEPSAVRVTDAPAWRTVSAQEAKAMIDKKDYDVILDVRTQAEYDGGHIKNALLIPDTELSERAENELPVKSARILIYCRTGRRSAAAARALTNMGYTDVYDFGGITNWDYEIVTE